MKNNYRRLDLLIRQTGRIGLWLNAILVYGFLYLPILILTIYSFNTSKFNAVWRGFTLDWYVGLLTGMTDTRSSIARGALWQALNNSLSIAAISTLVATVLGTMIALALERFRFFGRAAVESLLFIPIVIPDLAMGISLLAFYSLVFQLIESITGIRLVLGLSTVIIGHIVCNISFVAVTLRGRIAELETTLEEAAWDLGANEWQTMWRIILPLIAPGILSAALLAFTLSLDDFVITFFTAGVGATTLPVYVYGMIKFAVTPAINALSTLMLVASLILVLSSLAVQRRQTK